MMTKLFGASWKLTLAGYLGGILIVAQEMLESGTTIPTDGVGWIKFATGFVVAYIGWQAKSKDVSNSQHPMAVAQSIVTTPSGVVIAPKEDSVNAATKP